jgi:hypothetical protein
MSSKCLFKRRPKKLIDDPESPLYVRSLTVGEMKHVEELREKQQDEEALGYAVRRCCVDAKGERLLGDDEPLDEIPIDTLREISDAINKLSRGGTPEVIEKNSDATG